jgi:predicted RNA-binding Zn ribbon-like protein
MHSKTVAQEVRPPPFFIADALGLDFLNSIAHPTPLNPPVDWIASGEDLLEWMVQANLVPAEILKEFRRTAVPGELDAAAAQVRALREWFRVFVTRHQGKPLRPNALEELAPLNRVLEREEEFGQIGKRARNDDPAMHSGLVWRPFRRWRSPDTLLIPIARAMADLVCNQDFSDVKACEGPSCTLFFLDRTQARARRWCRMAVCGNRAKQAAHRKRVARSQ